MRITSVSFDTLWTFGSAVDINCAVACYSFAPQADVLIRITGSHHGKPALNAQCHQLTNDIVAAMVRLIIYKEITYISNIILEVARFWSISFIRETQSLTQFLKRLCAWTYTVLKLFDRNF